MRTKQATSVRLSPEAQQSLSFLAKTLGLSQASVLELAIRELALRKQAKRARLQLSTTDTEEHPHD